MPQSFRKPERLSSRKLIEELFSSGNYFFSYPFRVVWLYADREQQSPAQMTPTVPVRHFRKAVIRNLIKRRIREAYRKNKQPFYTKLSEARVNLVFMLQYTPREVMEYDLIEKGIKGALDKLSEKAVSSCNVK